MLVWARTPRSAGVDWLERGTVAGPPAWWAIWAKAPGSAVRSTVQQRRRGSLRGRAAEASAFGTAGFDMAMSLLMGWQTALRRCSRGSSRMNGKRGGEIPKGGQEQRDSGFRKRDFR